MKELLYKSIYREIFYHADKKIIEMNYLEGSSSTTDQIYKKEELIFCDCFDQKDIDFCYVNTVKFDYIIVPEIQNWVHENVNPVFIKTELKKLAILTSEQVFSRVSVMQMMNRFDKDEKGSFEIQHFISEKTAMEWLCE